MKTQREMLEDTREELQEKLDGLQTYLEQVEDRTEAHDTEEVHFEADVMRAENDARYYESEIASIDQALAEPAPRPSPLPEPGEVPWGLLSVAFLAGALLGRALGPRR